jgi:hypothetical protein
LAGLPLYLTEVSINNWHWLFLWPFGCFYVKKSGFSKGGFSKAKRL